MTYVRYRLKGCTLPSVSTFLDESEALLFAAAMTVVGGSVSMKTEPILIPQGSQQ